MKTLYLVRHAKSAWEFNLEDHERPLNERGLHDAPLVARNIKDEIRIPDKIMSSDAVRAKTTAMLYLKEFEIDQSVLILDPKLYDFNGREVEKIVRGTSDDVNCLMIFGHNNAMTSLVNRWGDLEIENVSTAALTELVFKQKNWAEIKNGITKQYITPKQFK